MSTKWICGLAAATVLSTFVGTPRASARPRDTIEFLNNYTEALLEAKKTGKPIFLEFRCAP
jgi:hypothetical protein